jgi:hypothetical protein
MNSYSFGEFEKEGREGESVVTCSEACPVLVALLKILYRDNKIYFFFFCKKQTPRNTALVQVYRYIYWVYSKNTGKMYKKVL